MKFKNTRVILFAVGLFVTFTFWIIKNPKLEPLDNGNIAQAELVDSLQNEIQRIQNELFISETTITRYEIALQYLKEEDSVAANRFELILSTKTE